MALSLPELEGKYEILQKIGGGGMGAVYKVRHLLLDEVRVVKVVRPQVEDRPSLKERFVHEARAATRLRHPNVAGILDFSVAADGTGFMVLEYIDGLTLLEILHKDGPPPLGLALEIGLQSLRAIEYLHRKGFVHRDISPDNLMLTVDVDERPLVKLIDLGIAKALEGGPDLTRTRQFLGKLRYASPESIRHGAAGVDVRSDLYSFGIVLYELLTGTYPIQGKDASSLMSGHLYEDVIGFEISDPHRRVPEPLREAVLKTLEKDPGRRFSTAGHLAASLRQVQETTAAADTRIETLTKLLTPSAVIELGSSRAPGTTQHGLDQLFPPEPTDAGEQPERPEAPEPAPPRAPVPTESTAADARSVVELKRRLHRARSCLRRAELAEARRLLVEALELQPASEEARAILEDLDRAEELAREEQQEKANLEQLFHTANRLMADADLEIARQEAAAAPPARSDREPAPESPPVRQQPTLFEPSRPDGRAAGWSAQQLERRRRQRPSDSRGRLGWILLGTLALVATAVVLWLVLAP